MSDVGYFRRTPGHKCERCGKDISNRHKTTKYCQECYNVVNRERKRKQDTYHAHLRARDVVNIRACCTEFADNPRYIFCPLCGQRIKE